MVLTGALLGAASTAALAQTVAFSGSGAVALGPLVVPPSDLQAGESFYSLAILPGTTAYTLNGQSGWTFESQFAVRLTPQAGGALAAAGTVTAFTFTRGADSLFGVGTTGSPDVSGGLIGIGYTVTGGTGLYAGYSGLGGSLVQLFGPPVPGVGYAEFNGLLTPVPEPATAPLLLAAGVMAWAARAAARRLRAVARPAPQGQPT